MLRSRERRPCRRSKQQGARSCGLPMLSAAVAVLAVVVLAGRLRGAQAARRSARRRGPTVQDELNVAALGAAGRARRATSSSAQGAGRRWCAIEPDIDQARVQPARRASCCAGDERHPHTSRRRPDLVVSMVYPLEGNEAALGLDYRATPEQLRGGAAGAGPRHDGAGRAGRPDARAAAASSSARRSSSTSDGRGAALLGHRLDGHRRGRRSTAAGGLERSRTSALDVVLTGRDGRSSDGEAFFGDPAILGQDPVTARGARCPSGAWQIAAVPKGGWPTPPALWGRGRSSRWPGC